MYYKNTTNQPLALQAKAKIEISKITARNPMNTKKLPKKNLFLIQYIHSKPSECSLLAQNTIDYSRKTAEYLIGMIKGMNIQASRKL